MISPPPPTINQTYKLVKREFANLVDKNDKPYIYHLEGVYMIAVTKYQVDEEHGHIALLHDIIEDTEIKIADLRHLGYSEKIIKGVDILSKRVGESYDEYTDRIVMDGWEMLWRVKMSDLEHNTTPHRLEGQNFSFFQRYVYAIKKIRAALEQRHER